MSPSGMATQGQERNGCKSCQSHYYLGWLNPTTPLLHSPGLACRGSSYVGMEMVPGCSEPVGKACSWCLLSRTPQSALVTRQTQRDVLMRGFFVSAHTSQGVVRVDGGLLPSFEAAEEVPGSKAFSRSGNFSRLRDTE